MEQNLEIIKDLARKILSNMPNLFRYDIECNQTTAVLRFFDIVDNEVYRMQGKYSEVIAICNFMFKNKRKRV